MQLQKTLSTGRRHLITGKMHAKLLAAAQRKGDDRARSLKMAAACRAAMRPSRFFSKLPPEIRVMIYGFAYGDEGGTIKVDFQRKARADGKALDCAFDPLIAVSKEWFSEALESFISSKMFNFGKIDRILYLNNLFDPVPASIRKKIVSISWHQKTIFSLPLQLDKLMIFTPKIRNLHITVRYGDCLDTIDQMPRFFEDLLGLRGLASFRLTVENEIFLRGKASGPYFQKRVNDQVTKGKGT